MSWFKKAEQVNAKAPAEVSRVTQVVKHRMTVTFHDGHNYWWEYTGLSPTLSAGAPFHDFYKWWFGRETPCYMVKGGDFQRMFLRSEVRTFEAKRSISLEDMQSGGAK